jgi:hypothetical protein
MMGAQEATVADELLVSALPDDVRAALVRLAAAGVLNELLDAYPEEYNGECDCGGYSEGDVLRAYRLAWKDSAATANGDGAGSETPTTEDGPSWKEARDACLAAGIL